MIAPDKLPPAREDYRYHLVLRFIRSGMSAKAYCYRKGSVRGDRHAMEFHLMGIRDDAYLMKTVRRAFGDWRDPKDEPAHAD